MTPTPSLAAAPSRAALVLLFASALAACGGGGDMAFEMPPADVSVAPVIEREVTRWDEFAGRVVAIEAVEVRPRVAGYIEQVHFTDGADVAAGTLLFTIDDREYRAALDVARADLARATSRRDTARVEAERTARLAEARAASGEELEQRQAEQRQAEADLRAAESRVRQAELNLEFTRVRAPIAGRVSDARVRAGNLVGQGEPLLTTVVSLDPIDVGFQADERVYLATRAAARAADGAPVRVRVGLATETGFPHEGELAFVDNALDPATGTIRARARLANPDGMFVPGLFARVRLMGGEAAPALLVHPQAVLTDQDRKYVYVVGEGSRAERRDVVVGPEVDGLRVVESGLAPGDRVVVNGVRRIFMPGMALNPREVPMDRPDTPPPAAQADGQSAVGG
jgi:multidrug efflux system membrane fusion protein